MSLSSIQIGRAKNDAAHLGHFRAYTSSWRLLAAAEGPVWWDTSVLTVL